MNLNAAQFLNLDACYTDIKTAFFALLPIPFEGAVSYGVGAAHAPQAIIEASRYLELYDEVLDFEPYKAGITTFSPTAVSANQIKIQANCYEAALKIMEMKKFPIFVGGDHSISSSTFKAVQKRYSQLSCVQIDAHADLRQEYEGSKLSHASVLARIRETGADAVQIGIRSMCMNERNTIREKSYSVYTMHDYRKNPEQVFLALQKLSGPVYLTVDVDAFDWSVIPSTGTPEPGGFLWDEAMFLFSHLFSNLNIVACDVVELSPEPGEKNSPFAAAKLIYKFMAFKIKAYCHQFSLPLPQHPDTEFNSKEG
jgi:agmatinase